MSLVKFDVTRNSPKWTLNSSGNLQSGSNNLPGFEFNPDNSYRGVLVEEKRTNLLSYPQNFADVYWTKNDASIEGDPATAGSDIHAGWDFTIGWTPEGSATIVDSDTFSTSTNATGVRPNAGQIPDASKYYQIRVAGTITNGTLTIKNGYGGSVSLSYEITGTFDETVYGLGGLGTVGVGYVWLQVTNITGTATVDITTFEIREVQPFDGPFVDSIGTNLKNAYKLVENTDNDFHGLQTVQSVSASTTYSISVFAKYNGRNLAFRFYNEGANPLYVSIFDLSNGTVVSSVDPSIASIEPVGNGYYKCSTTFTTTETATQMTLQLRIVDGTTLSYTGDGASGVYICHAQIEEGTESTSPMFDTPGSTTTRNEDVITLTSASQYLPSEGKVTFGWEQKEDDTIYIGALSASVASGSRELVYEYSSTEQTLSIDGTEVQTVTGQFDFSNMNEIQLGHVNGIDQPNTHLKYFAVE